MGSCKELSKWKARTSRRSNGSVYALPRSRKQMTGPGEKESPSTCYGENMTGWMSWDGGEPVGWSVKDGTLASTGRGQDIVSQQKFWNFELHVEFRLAQHSNSGVALRNR